MADKISPRDSRPETRTLKLTKKVHRWTGTPVWEPVPALEGLKVVSLVAEGKTIYAFTPSACFYSDGSQFMKLPLQKAEMASKVSLARFLIKLHDGSILPGRLGLDRRNMEPICKIRRRSADDGVRVLVTTHDLELLARVWDAALCLPFFPDSQGPGV